MGQPVNISAAVVERTGFTTEIPNAGNTQRIDSKGKFVLDDKLGIQYNGPQTIGGPGFTTLSKSRYNDSPGNALGAAFKKSTAQDSFKLFLMYKSDETDSIWVTLGLVNWNWAGETTRIGAPASKNNNWNPPTGTALQSDSNGASSIELPEWSQSFTGLGGFK